MHDDRRRIQQIMSHRLHSKSATQLVIKYTTKFTPSHDWPRQVRRQPGQLAERNEWSTRLITQCGIMIFIGIGGGTVWLQNWNFGESLTFTVFSMTCKFKGPCVMTLKIFLNGNAGHSLWVNAHSPVPLCVPPRTAAKDLKPKRVYFIAKYAQMPNF